MREAEGLSGRAPSPARAGEIWAGVLTSTEGRGEWVKRYRSSRNSADAGLVVYALAEAYPMAGARRGGNFIAGAVREACSAGPISM